jgi:hypothetical protein
MCAKTKGGIAEDFFGFVRLSAILKKHQNKGTKRQQNLCWPKRKSRHDISINMGHQDCIGTGLLKLKSKWRIG